MNSRLVTAGAASMLLAGLCSGCAHHGNSHVMVCGHDVVEMNLGRPRYDPPSLTHLTSYRSPEQVALVTGECSKGEDVKLARRTPNDGNDAGIDVVARDSRGRPTAVIIKNHSGSLDRVVVGHGRTARTIPPATD